MNTPKELKRIVALEELIDPPSSPLCRLVAVPCSPSSCVRYGPDLKALATHVCQWIEERTDDVNVEMRDRAEACLRHYLSENIPDQPR